MNKNSLYLPLIIAMTLGACSKEDTPLPTLDQHTYTGSELTVNYCGDEMPAKQVIFTPQLQSSSRVSADATGISATLSMSGILDLASLGITDIPALPAPGILPGDTETDIHITLIPDTKEGAYTFSGTDQTSYVRYSYAGTITDNHLTLDISDAKLINTALAGKIFRPTPVNASLSDLKNPQDITTPFYIDWTINNIPGVQLDPAILVNALTLAPIIPVYNNTAYSSLAQVFTQCVQTMALLDNGNIPVRYYSSKEGATQLLTTNPNMLQYVVTGQNSLQLYINPMSAVSLWLVAQSKPTWLPSFFDTAYADKIKEEIANVNPGNNSEADKAIKDALIQSLLLAIRPAMSQGLPMQFRPTDQGIALYLDTKTCTDFIGLLLTEISQQPVLAERLSQYLLDAGITQEEAQALLQQLPALLQATTTLNIGLNLQTLPQ